MVIFPLAPDQTIAQMWSNGVIGRTVAPGSSSSSCKWERIQLRASDARRWRDWLDVMLVYRCRRWCQESDATRRRRLCTSGWW